MLRVVARERERERERALGLLGFAAVFGLLLNTSEGRGAFADVAGPESNRVSGKQSIRTLITLLRWSALQIRPAPETPRTG